MFACRSLINSRLSKKIDWILLDSTADSNIIAPLYKRGVKAAKRLLIFIKHLFFSRFNEALIFTADGFSFIEKGVMVLLAKFFRKRVILAPRSGIIINDLTSSRFMKWFIPFVFRKTDVIICQGPTWKNLFYNLINVDEQKFITIQNWINSDQYFEINHGASKNDNDVFVKQQANLRGNERISKTATKTEKKKSINILYLSWVDENKGILDLISAAKLIVEKYPDISFQIAGDGRAMKKSIKLVKELKLEKQFNFLGWVNGESKLILLANADIYVLPSYFEGFPNSLLEAMASSIPVISTDVGSIADVIKQKENGLLIKPGDIEGLSNSLVSLINDPALRKRLGENARKTIENNNTLNGAIAKFENIFELI